MARRTSTDSALRALKATTAQSSSSKALASSRSVCQARLGGGKGREGRDVTDTQPTGQVGVFRQAYAHLHSARIREFQR